LSRVTRKQSEVNEGEKRTAEFLHETYEAIRQDMAKRMQPAERKGVTGNLHYKTLMSVNFIPPLLHMEMGLVNKVWDDIETWTDDEVERFQSMKRVPLQRKARCSFQSERGCKKHDLHRNKNNQNFK
jgi:hypothetical protein